MSKRSRDLGLCVGVRVACCGPPHPNRDRDKDKSRTNTTSSTTSSSGSTPSDTAASQQQPLDFYGVITREGSAANGGWFEVQLDSQPDKKVYYRRGSICKLKQQPNTQQQQTAVRAITHASHPPQQTTGLVAAAMATPATLLSTPLSPPTAFVFQHQSPQQQLYTATQEQQQHAVQCTLPSGAVLLSPTVTHCGDGYVPPLLLQSVQPCVSSPVVQPVCTCSLGCSPVLPSAPVAFVPNINSRRASTGSVDGSLSLSVSLASLSSCSSVNVLSPSGSGGCGASPVELHSPPFAASGRCVSTPIRPLMLSGVSSSTSSSSSSGSSSASVSPSFPPSVPDLAHHPSAFTSVSSSAAAPAIVAPRAVRLAATSVPDQSLLHALSAPVLPLSVAVPAARRPSITSSHAAIPISPFTQPLLAVSSTAEMAPSSGSAGGMLYFDSSKRRRLSLEDVDSLMVRSLSAVSSSSAAACSSAAAYLPTAFVQPHSVPLCSL